MTPSGAYHHIPQVNYGMNSAAGTPYIPLSFASWSATISAARAVGEIYSFRSKVKINLATHPQLGNEI